MKTFTISVDSETLDIIVREQLESYMSNLKHDLENRNSDIGIPVFSMNKEEDISEIKKHIEAFERVISYSF